MRLLFFVLALLLALPAAAQTVTQTSSHPAPTLPAAIATLPVPPEPPHDYEFYGFRLRWCAAHFAAYPDEAAVIHVVDGARMTGQAWCEKDPAGFAAPRPLAPTPSLTSR